MVYVASLDKENATVKERRNQTTIQERELYDLCRFLQGDQRAIK